MSSIYDPIGFCAPFVLKAKLILQVLCRKRYQWDEPIPPHYMALWESWLLELPKLQDLAVNRCFKPPSFGKIVSSQIYHFADGSQSGYSSVSYLRLEDDEGNVKCSFIMGKSRLAPIKPVTIPRLLAAVVAAHVDRMCRKELNLQIDESKF